MRRSKIGAMKTFNLHVQIAKQEDGLWRASVPDLQGCWVDAETVQQALDEIQDVAAMIIDLAEENDEVLPSSVSPTDEAAFEARIPLVLGEHHFVRRSPRRAKTASR